MGIKQAILGLLSNGPVHGYDLKSAFEEQLVPDGNLNFGQVYTTLDRMKRDGLVGQRVVSQAERPDKKVYALTDAGRRELKQWLSTPSALDLDLRNETFLKLMVARSVSCTHPVEVLAVERRACLIRLHEMTQARAQGEREGVPIQTMLLLELALLRLEAFAKWLDRCEQVLTQEQSP